MQIELIHRHPEVPIRTTPDVETLPLAQRLKRALVVIDKPAGCTSHDVVDRVRRIMKTRRVGHSGTLDPEVTGVLPIGLGQGTRVLSLLLESGKTYDCEMHLHGDEPPEHVTDVLREQIGTITQLPPIKSRVKRVERERDVYALEITKIERRRVRFIVACEAGTYIRKLCHDVGQQLGCGAHMAGLRRLKAGGFTEADAISIETLGDAAGAYRRREGDDPESGLRAIIRPIEAALSDDLPRLWIDEGALTPIVTGSPLALPGVIAFTDNLQAGADCVMLTITGWLVAIATSEMDAATAKESTRGIIARQHRVLWPMPE